MNVKTIDLGRSNSRLTFPPVVVGPPIACDLPHRRQPNALRFVGNRLSVRPARCLDALAHFGKLRFGNAHMKRANRGFVADYLSCNAVRSATPLFVLKMNKLIDYSASIDW